MEKEKLCYDLALIYTQSRFCDYLSQLSEMQKLDYASLVNLLYCYFEDAYIILQLMDDKRFDFSDVENMI